MVSDDATLTIAIEGGAVAATDDTDSASVEFANVVDNTFFDETAALAILLGSNQYVSASFVVDDATAVSGTIAVNTLVTAAASGTLYLEEQTSPGTWATVEDVPFSLLLGIGNIATINLASLGLDEGTYRVRATLSGAASAVSVVSDVDATFLDQYVISDSDGAAGNLLDNDETGSLLTELQVFDPVTSGYLDVDAGAPVTIQGTYGVLTLEADGSYTYAPDANQAYFDTAQVDTFEYQLVHPGGDVAQGTLEVTVEPSGAGIPVPLMAATFAFEADTVPIDALDSDGDGQADGAETTGFFEFDMLEGQGSVEDVLENYLRESELGNDAANDAAGPVPISVPEATGAAATFEDPLAHLSSTSDLSTEDQWQNNSLI